MRSGDEKPIPEIVFVSLVKGTIEAFIILLRKLAVIFVSCGVDAQRITVVIHLEKQALYQFSVCKIAAQICQLFAYMSQKSVWITIREAGHARNGAVDRKEVHNRGIIVFVNVAATK